MSIHDERREWMLQYFREPHTLREAAKESGLTYATARRVVEPLLKDGRVKEVALKQGHQKVYCLDPNIEQGGIIKVLTKNGYVPLGQLMQVRVDQYAHNMMAILAQIWLYSMFHGAESIDNAKAGRMPLATLKPLMRDSLEQVRRVVPIMEQLLLSDIWTDPSPANAEKFGPVDMQRALQLQDILQRRYNK